MSITRADILRTRVIRRDLEDYIHSKTCNTKIFKLLLSKYYVRHEPMSCNVLKIAYNSNCAYRITPVGQNRYAVVNEETGIKTYKDGSLCSILIELNKSIINDYTKAYKSNDRHEEYTKMFLQSLKVINDINSVIESLEDKSDDRL